MPILDFKELSTSHAGAPAGEVLEGLVRELGRRLGLDPKWAGRGADQGRDLFFVERRRGRIGSDDLRWLVSCKDFAHSGRSVSEADVGPVLDKLAQHGADGFLLVTTTTASTGLKALLDGIPTKTTSKTQVWDRVELETLLLEDQNVDLLKRHLPDSYAACKRLGGLPQALMAFEALVPPPVYARIKKLIETYQVDETWLTGERIWSDDRESAKTIDLAIAALFDESNPAKAARQLLEGEIEFDAFEAVLKTLASFKPDSAQSLCRHLVEAGDSGGASLFAFRFYVENFEPDNENQILLAMQLPSEDLSELYAGEIASYIQEELDTEPTRYRAWDDLDSLSPRTSIRAVHVETVALAASTDDARLTFRAPLRIAALLSQGREGPNESCSFDGCAEGYISAYGVFLEDITVDTQSRR